VRYSRNSDEICVIPEIAFYYDRSGQHLLRASALSAPLREIIVAQGLRAGNLGAASPLQAPPSVLRTATSPSSFDRLRIDREDLGYLASTVLGFPV
jgi:hypothetical protein